jgi:hypothetical protein
LTQKLLNNTTKVPTFFINKTRNGILTICGIILLTLNSSAQNIDEIIDKAKNKDPLVLSGSITTGMSAYAANGIDNRRNPFAFYTSIAPTVSFRGFSLPFSFTYRDQKGSFSQPFQRIKINPTYKWISVGYGNVTMDLNPYVFSGQYYKGYSLQLTPGKFRFKAGYGDLENPLAQIDTIVEGAFILPAYKRKAITALIGYGAPEKHVDLTFFRAKDLIAQSEVGDINPDLVTPQENLALGLDFEFEFWKKFNFKGNLGASAYTSNISSVGDFGLSNEVPILQALSSVFTYNLTSKLQLAGDASINYKVKHFGTGIEYKRVSPGYQTLGTYYFQEDFQNITLKMNISTPKNKLRFNGSGGIQTNNLNGLRESTRSRKIINTTLMFSPWKAFNTTIRVANFQSDRTPSFSRINDTIKFTQTTENYSIMPLVMLKGEKNSTTISAMVNYQKLIDLGLQLDGYSGIDNYTGNLNVSVYNKSTDVGITGSVLYNKNVMGLNENQRIGLNGTYAKKVLKKKMSLSGNLGYMVNTQNNTSDGFTITTNASMNYKIKRKISAGINGNILFRNSATQNYQEFRATARVSYHFTTKKS